MPKLLNEVSIIMKYMEKSRTAFTLAEVLITIGIIGIVAALTIPNLLVQHRERANISKLKTVYSTITQAYTRAVTEFGRACQSECPYRRHAA